MGLSIRAVRPVVLITSAFVVAVLSLRLLAIAELTALAIS